MLVLAASLLPVFPASGLTCGVWRWPVNTLSDRRASKVDHSPVHRRVDQLRKRDAPAGLSTNTKRIRETVEFRTITVHARPITAVIEDDHDVHLVIAQPHHRAHTMIVEFPDIACNGARRSAKKAEMAKARSDFIAACGSVGTSFVDLKGKASITGVGFFDEIHGQRGVAPNGIKLHPVLSFSGTCSRT